jgi:Asp-tRNA(Asn)/Glu-tRNA(Gln) amidotransferase A subunit family amidase
MDAADLTATDALARIQAGQLSPVALAEACLARIADREPVIRAMAYLDPEAVLGAARTAPAGRLQGIPVGVKDVLDTADMPSEYGSPIWAGHRPVADSAAVAWTRAEGGVVLGKTVTTEFATRKPGPTANPHNTGHTPGGSSSGSAAGVAAGFFPVAFGTQTAGSVIRPAAYCGVVGYKPTFGMISRAGMKIMSSSLDTIGVIARSVADCALLAGAVSGRDLGDPARRAERAPRIGLCRSAAWDQAAPETVALLEGAASRLSRAGAVVTDVDLPPVFARAAALHAVIMNAESGRTLGWELAHHRDQISAALLDRLDWGLAQPAALLDEAEATFAAARLALPGVMEPYDILLTPAAPGEAPEGLGWTGDPVFNSLWTGLLVPCVTVPAGTGPKGLPLGLQVVAAAGADAAALHWAAWLMAACGGLGGL